VPQTRARSGTAECHDRERDKQHQAGFVGTRPPRMCSFPAGIWTAGAAVAMLAKRQLGREESSKEMKCCYSTSSRPKGIAAPSFIFELAGMNFSEVCAD